MSGYKNHTTHTHPCGTVTAWVVSVNTRLVTFWFVSTSFFFFLL